MAQNATIKTLVLTRPLAEERIVLQYVHDEAIRLDFSPAEAFMDIHDHTAVRLRDNKKVQNSDACVMVF